MLHEPLCKVSVYYCDFFFVKVYFNERHEWSEYLPKLPIAEIDAFTINETNKFGIIRYCIPGLSDNCNSGICKSVNVD
jgi:hypothetical protein